MKMQKPALWIGSSRDDLRAFPDEVRRVLGLAINDAQNGEEHPRAKALKGFGGRSVLEVVDETVILTAPSTRFVSRASSMYFMPFRRNLKRESRPRGAQQYSYSVVNRAVHKLIESGGIPLVGDL